MKTIKSLLVLATSSLAFLSCGGSDPVNPTKENNTDSDGQEETYTYSVVVSTEFKNGGEIINSSHNTLFSIYESATIFATKETQENANFKTVTATSGDGADRQAKLENESRYKQVLQATQFYMQSLANELKTFTPNEYTSLTAKLDGILSVKLVRTGNVSTTIRKDDFPEILSFNADKQMVPYEIALIPSYEGTLDKNATPVFCQAFEAAEKALMEDFDRVFKNAKEGNGTKKEYFCVQSNDLDFRQLNSYSNKYMTKRKAAVVNWAETADNAFLNKFAEFDIPDEEWDIVNYVPTYKIVLTYPYKYCSSCNSYSQPFIDPSTATGGCQHMNTLNQYTELLADPIELPL